MVFSSLIFIFAYLTVTLAVYYIAPLRFRNLVLFIVSLAFYGWGEPKYITLMLVSIISAYAFGFAIEKYKAEKPKIAKLMLGLSIGVNLSFLLFFKYYNFFAANLGFSVMENLTLPVGISFYTFQIMSYSIDLYRSEVSLAKKIIPFGTYVTLFPQLIAGPIVRYKDVCDQLESRRETISKFAKGVNRFVIGLSKKLILGDAAAALAEYFEKAEGFAPSIAGSWMVILFYTFHIYFDFSGYSDMAVGLGRMFGFEFIENFNYPYIAHSITDFWRRWHITLSTWFKEYIYIPLGGNRCGIARSFFNLSVVWLLTGFWHGADWNYIVWGIYFLVFLIMEKLFLGRILKKHSPIAHVYTLLVIGFGWLIFFHNDLSLVFTYIKTLFGIGANFINPQAGFEFVRLIPFIAVCALGCTPLPKRIYNSLSNRFSAIQAVSPILTAMLFTICIAYMVDNSFSPFLYYIF